MYFLCLPVGSPVELRVNPWLIHNGPGRRGDKKLFVDTVSKAVGDPACHMTKTERQRWNSQDVF